MCCYLHLLRKSCKFEGELTQSGLLALIVEKHQETGIDNAVVETKVVKMIQNGQLFIISNGKVYNATGAVVK